MEQWETKLRIDIVKHTVLSGTKNQRFDNLFRCLVMLQERACKKWAGMTYEKGKWLVTKQRIYKIQDMLYLLKHGFREEIAAFLQEFFTEYVFVD